MKPFFNLDQTTPLTYIVSRKYPQVQYLDLEDLSGLSLIYETIVGPNGRSLILIRKISSLNFAYRKNNVGRAFF